MRIAYRDDPAIALGEAKDLFSSTAAAGAKR